MMLLLLCGSWLLRALAQLAHLVHHLLHLRHRRPGAVLVRLNLLLQLAHALQLVPLASLRK